MRKIVLIGSVLFFAGAISVQAQDREALYNAISTMDSLLFTAFNNRDIEPIKQIFSTDLEFFHDKGGLSGYDQNIQQLSANFQGGNSPQRELLRETMEVYPIPGYGAIQYAEHRFCHPENGKMECATFKFVHVWQLKDGKWKLTRVVSFDHP